MHNELVTILKQPIRFLNNNNQENIYSKPNNAIASFAIDDAIATTVGNVQAPTTFRMWVHDKTVVCGIPDSRLPYFDEGVQLIQNRGYNVIIRNSGGLAVTLDRGVLNMSMILRNDRNVSIHYGYDLMLQFVRTLFQDYTSSIKAYEIVGSYCPGDYDLSINGVKFAGISQRRVRNGVAVQIYIDIEGSSKQRAMLIKDFYDVSKKDASTKYTYPNVNPNVMGTINELLGTTFTVQDVITMVEQLLNDYHVNQLANELIDDEKDVFLTRWTQMQKRNEQIKLD